MRRLIEEQMPVLQFLGGKKIKMINASAVGRRRNRGVSIETVVPLLQQ